MAQFGPGSYGRFQKMFDDSGMNKIAAAMTPNYSQRDYSYKRGPARQRYMDFASQGPEYKNPNIWYRLGAALATGGNPMATQKLLRQPYEQQQEQYSNELDRLKAAAMMEGQEIDDQRQALNQQSLDERRQERGQHEIASEVRRINDATARGVRADERFNWQKTEKDQTQADTAAWRKEIDKDRDAARANVQARHNERMARLRGNDAKVNIYEQEAIDKRAGDMLLDEFPNAFNVEKDPKTGKVIKRELKEDVPDEDAAQIEERYNEILEEIVSKTEKDYLTNEEDENDDEDEEDIANQISQPSPQPSASPSPFANKDKLQQGMQFWSMMWDLYKGKK